MGKRTPRRGAPTPVTPASHNSKDVQPAGHYVPDVPQVVVDKIGRSIACGQLAGVLQGPAGKLYLPIETMVSSAIAPGELVLVGVATEAPEVALPLSPLGFEVNGFDSHQDAKPPRMVLQPIRSILSHHMGWPLQDEGGLRVGDYVALAEARPAPQLQRNGVALSPDVAAAIGRPGRGAPLLLYRSNHIKLPDRNLGTAQPRTPSTQIAHAPRISLSLCTDARGQLAATLPRGAPVLGPRASPLPSPVPKSPQVVTPVKAAGSVVTPGRPSSERSPPGTQSSSTRAAQPRGPPVQSVEMLAALASQQLSHTKMLQSLAAAALEGSWPLPGNLVGLPIASNIAALQVCSSTGAQLASDVEVQIVAPSRSPGLGQLPALDHPIRPEAVDALGAALLAAVAEVALGRRRTAVAAAEAAAVAEVGGGPEGPAAQAARRSTNAGCSASRGGFADLGGVQGHQEQLRKLVTLPLQAPQLFHHYGLRPPRGVLLHGPPGCGKTVLAAAAAADAGAALFVINGSDIVSEGVGDSEAGLRGVFAAARGAAPSVIFLDEADAVAPARSGGASSGGPAADASGRLVSCLLNEMDRGTPPVPSCPPKGVGKAGPHNAQEAAAGDRVVVIAATNRLDALDTALRRPGRFDRELHIGVPSPDQRRHILGKHLATVNHSLTEGEVEDVAHAAHAFVAADVAALVAEAAMTALRRHVSYQVHGQRRQEPDAHAAAVRSLTDALDAASLTTTAQRDAENSKAPLSESVDVSLPDKSLTPVADMAADITAQDGTLQVSLQDFQAARTRVRPSALREVSVEVPATRWDDVGGMQSVKDSLKEAVEWPQKHPERLAALGARPPGGILLYGPPGCSKTLLGRAVAGEAGLNFLSVKGPELFSKFVGESEKAVATLFARARQTAPAVVFLDELDGLAPPRGSHGDSVETRVMATLLQEMDGLQGREAVTVVAATNRPDLVDAALLRAGRFDRLLPVDPPDAAARAAILAVHTRRSPLGPDVDLHALADRTEFFTGADLQSLVREAGLAALEESFDAPCIAARHFEVALPAVNPTGHVTEHMQEIYDSFARGGSHTRPN